MKNLLESELFGHERGSFTGGARRKERPCFEVADSGTTVSRRNCRNSMLAFKPSFLGALCRNIKIRRVGGTHELAVDVRVVAATNRDLCGAMVG